MSRGRGAILAVALALSAGLAAADAPERSIRPLARAVTEAAAPAAQASAAGRAGADSAAQAGASVAAAVARAERWIDTPAGPRLAGGSATLAASVRAGTGGEGTETATRREGAEAARLAALTPGEDDPRPQPRLPGFVERASSSGSIRPLDAGVEALADIRPRARPASLLRPVNPAQMVAVVQPSASRLAVLRSPRPAARPENLRRLFVVRTAAMIPTQPDPGNITGRRGAVCGDPAIRGETIAPIAGRVSGCGLADGVRVTEVDGVRLSTAITVDCPTARALRGWVTDTVKPTVGRLGGGVASLEVFAHYACRPRNNQRGAKISEHGRGRAVDIGAIVLANGRSISVLNHWRDGSLGPLLKAMHRGACGPFGTVLGPQADRFHQNHLHLDTARYRSGSYCR